MTHSTKQMWSPAPKSSGIRACAFSPGGDHIIAGSYDNLVRVWPASAGTTMRSQDPRQNEANNNNNNTVEVDCSVDLRDNSVLEFRGHRGWIFSCNFSPDERFVVSGAGNPDYGVRIWSTQTQEQLMELPGNVDHVSCCSFSPDGRLLLTSAENHRLRMWDATCLNAIE